MEPRCRQHLRLWRRLADTAQHGPSRRSPLCSCAMTDITLHHQGRRLAASTFGPRGAPPVLLLHGVTQCRDTWEEVALSLIQI